jgi:hypothetical protein
MPRLPETYINISIFIKKVKFVCLAFLIIQSLFDKMWSKIKGIQHKTLFSFYLRTKFNMPKFSVSFCNVIKAKYKQKFR